MDACTDDFPESVGPITLQNQFLVSKRVHRNRFYERDEDTIVFGILSDN